MSKICALAVFVLFICHRSFSQTGCVDYYSPGEYPKQVSTKQGVVSFSWNSEAWNFPMLNHLRKISYTNTPAMQIANGMFKGLLEYLPPGYNDVGNAAKQYPVIIFFHGGASAGNGSELTLCRLFKDAGSDMATHKSIPGRIENEQLPLVTNYIVLAPQFSVYNRPLDETLPSNYPSAEHVDAVLEYVYTHYRANKKRIFLTGYSNGANIISEYAASSVERAKRVAGIMPVSFCSGITSSRNIQKGIHPSKIGAAGLPTWFVQCANDVPCNLTFPQPWVDEINATPGSKRPRFTILNDANSNPLYQCSDTLLHDAWSRAYDPAFRISYNSGTHTSGNDGINLNMIEWFNAQADAVLPIVLKSFKAILVNQKVVLEWITASEKDNDYFTIERAGPDQRFINIGQVNGGEDYNGERKYSFIDNNPLSGMNYYRLVQTDIDGKKTYFEIKRILNSSDKNSSVIVSPNPFGENLAAFVSLDKSQKLFLSVSDMTGKILKTTTGIYGQGSTEVRIHSNDLPKGIYLLKVSGENFSSTHKVIKK
jgi:predicted esterase